MDNVQMKIVRSDGRVLETRPGGWTVEESKLENYDTFEQEITTEANVLTDGSSLISKRLGQIDRTAYLAYLGKDKTLIEQQTEAKTFFNPKYSFQVYMTHNGRTRWVEGELDAFQCSIYKGMFVTEITFTILCLDPYWRDADGNDRSLTDAEPMFGFPFVSIINERALEDQESSKPVENTVWITTGKVQSAEIETNEGSPVGRTVIYGARKSKSILPEGYTELEFIESTGTQNIDTGIMLDQTHSMEFKVTPTSFLDGTGGGFYFASMTSYPGTGIECQVWQGVFYNRINGVDKTVANPMKTGKVYLMSLSNGSLTISGGDMSAPVVLDTGLGTYSSSTTLKLCSLARTSQNTYGAMKVHGCVIKKGDEMIRDYRPCKRDSDGAIGLYDLVGNRFYGNAGTGVFVAGEEVYTGFDLLEQVSLNIGGERWDIDLGGVSLDDGNVMTIEKDGSSSIDGVPSPKQSVPKFNASEVSITSESNVPHYFDVEYQKKRNEPLGSIIYPVQGFLASRLIFDGQNTIYNTGDVPCEFKAVFDFKGDITNPKIEKDGKFVRVLDTFKDGDTLEIDFMSMPPKVTKNGENIIQKSDRYSSFTGMTLPVGSSIIKYSCDNMENRSLMDVRVLFYDRYMGV